ncbi:MAG: hypothetical protein ACP5E3_15715 [Bacteroidales bacterium]
MKKLKESRRRGHTFLSRNELQSLCGGRLWPFFNIEEILSGIYYEEDMNLMLLIKN